VSAIDSNGELEDYRKSHCYRWGARRNRRSSTEIIELDLTRPREARFWRTSCCHTRRSSQKVCLYPGSFGNFLPVQSLNRVLTPCLTLWWPFQVPPIAEFGTTWHLPPLNPILVSLMSVHGTWAKAVVRREDRTVFWMDKQGLGTVAALSPGLKHAWGPF
jgi:hypothetical protein